MSESGTSETPFADQVERELAALTECAYEIWDRIREIYWRAHR